MQNLIILDLSTCNTGTFTTQYCAHISRIFGVFFTLFDKRRLQKMIYPSYEMPLFNSMNTARSSSRLVSDLIFYCHDNTPWSITTRLFGNSGHQTASVPQLRSRSTLGLSKNLGADRIAMKPLAKCWLQIRDLFNWWLLEQTLQIAGC